MFKQFLITNLILATTFANASANTTTNHSLINRQPIIRPNLTCVETDSIGYPVNFGQGTYSITDLTPVGPYRLANEQLWFNTGYIQTFNYTVYVKQYDNSNNLVFSKQFDGVYAADGLGSGYNVQMPVYKDFQTSDIYMKAINTSNGTEITEGRATFGCQ